jgi:regulator of sigma E protease
MLTLLSFLVLLGTVVVVHEYGHYKAAVTCGVKVLKFSVGFGVPLIAWQLHPLKRVNPNAQSASGVIPTSGLTGYDPSKTLFLISAIPLGGFVKMLDEREAPVEEPLLKQAFNRQSLCARAFIVAAGPCANFVLALMLYAGLNWFGQSLPAPLIATPHESSALQGAGAQAGDRILGVKYAVYEASQVREIFVPTNSYPQLQSVLRDIASDWVDADKRVAAESDGRASEQQRKHTVELAIWRDRSAFCRNKSGAESKDSTNQVDDLSTLDQDQDLQRLAQESNIWATLDMRPWRLDDVQSRSERANTWTLPNLGFSGPMRKPVISSVLASGVAEQAGLRAGDQILEVNGVCVIDAKELVYAVRHSFATPSANALMTQIEPSYEPKELAFLIRRDQPSRIKDAPHETTQTIRLLPKLIKEGGQISARMDAIIGGEPLSVFVRLGAWEGLMASASKTFDLASLSLSSFSQMFTGETSWRELSGPLTLADYAGKSAKLGLANFVNFLAFVSVSIGVLNLLPIPLLDGGQLMYYLWEAGSGHAPSVRWQGWLMKLGLMVLFLLMFVALFNDLLRLVG